MVEHVKEATKKVIEMKEKIIEKRVELRRQARRAAQLQEHEEENRIQSDMFELENIVQARKRKEERKRKAQLKTAATVKPKPAFEKPAIMTLGNSALLKKDGPATDGPVEELGENNKKTSRVKEGEKNRGAPFKPIL